MHSHHIKKIVFCFVDRISWVFFLQFKSCWTSSSSINIYTGIFFFILAVANCRRVCVLLWLRLFFVHCPANLCWHLKKVQQYIRAVAVMNITSVRSWISISNNWLVTFVFSLRWNFSAFCLPLSALLLPLMLKTLSSTTNLKQFHKLPKMRYSFFVFSWKISEKKMFCD